MSIINSEVVHGSEVEDIGCEYIWILVLFIGVIRDESNSCGKGKLSHNISLLIILCIRSITVWSWCCALHNINYLWYLLYFLFLFLVFSLGLCVWILFHWNHLCRVLHYFCLCLLWLFSCGTWVGWVLTCLGYRLLLLLVLPLGTGVSHEIINLFRGLHSSSWRVRVSVFERLVLGLLPMLLLSSWVLDLCTWNSVLLWILLSQHLFHKLILLLF